MIYTYVSIEINNTNSSHLPNKYIWKRTHKIHINSVFSPFQLLLSLCKSHSVSSFLFPVYSASLSSLLHFSLQSTPYLLPVYSPYHFCLLNSLSCLLPISIESTPQIWEYPVLYTELECNEQLSTIKTYILAFGFVLKKHDESNEQFSTIKTVILASGFVHKFVMYTFLDW